LETNIRQAMHGDPLKKTNAFILLESDSGNKYLSDQQEKCTKWCHPILYQILKMHDRDVDLTQWFLEISQRPGNQVFLEDCGNVSKEDVIYYYNKYRLMLENGFFSKVDIEHYLSGRLSAEDILSALVNTKQVTFEVVDYCNLDCAYCTYGQFYDNYDKREYNKLDPAIAKNFLSYMQKLLDSPINKSHGKPFYIGFYGGEPLLNFPFIKEVVQFAKELNFRHNKVFFNMTTNAILLDKHMDFLAEHDFIVLVSLDGNEYNNSYRVLKDGSPAFPMIIKNLELLQSRYPRYFEKRVNFNAVFHNRNSISDIHQFFKSRFGKIPTISQLNPTGVRPSMRETFWKTYANIEASIKEVEDYSLLEKDFFTRIPDISGASDFLNKYSGFVFSDYNELLISEKALKTYNRLPTGTCVPFDRKVFITALGKILPCEQIGFQYALGKVTQNEVDLDFQKIAQTYNSYYDRLKKNCLSCSNWDSCFQCLFYLNLDDPVIKCSGLMEEDVLHKYYASQLSYLEGNRHLYYKIMKEVRID